MGFLNYTGKLYAKLGIRKYCELEMTAADVDKLVEQLDKAKTIIRKCLDFMNNYGLSPEEATFIDESEAFLQENENEK